MLKRDPKCERCPLHKSASYVCLLGEGKTPCEIMIVGEAPGVNEEKEGRPFVGKAGQKLRKALERYDFLPEDFYITNACLCRPPGNRTPKKKEIEACSYWMDKQLKEVYPRYVLLLGNPAIQSVLGVTGITKHRGRPIEQDGVIYLPTWHPSGVIRVPSRETSFDADLRLFDEIVESGGIPETEGVSAVVVDTWKKVDTMLSDLRGGVSFDIETSCLYPWDKDARINAIGFGTSSTQWIVPIGHEGSKWSVEDIDKIIEKLDKALLDCCLIAHNGKFDSLWMRVFYGVQWEIDFDTMLAHYLLDENSGHRLKYLSQVYLGAMEYDIDATTALWEELVEYLAKDLLYTRKLRYIFGKMLYRKGDIKEVFAKIVMPCVGLFIDAEYHGVCIDTSKMDEVEEDLTKQIVKLKRRLDKHGKDINWNSPAQIAKLLFEDAGLSVIEKTKTGAASTKESVLKRLDHPIVNDLLSYRSATKLKSTYIEGWKPYLHRNIMHPTFNLHGTVTGRLSCEHPNLTNVPRDSKLRSLITAPRGWVFAEGDLSQIELRIAAELSGETHMLDIFYQGKDIHWTTAIREIARAAGKKDLVLDTAYKYRGKRLSYDQAIICLLDMGAAEAIKINKEWKEARFRAKAINFGFLYGMWFKKFRTYAEDEYGIKLTEAQAREAREAYFELYPGLLDWHERQKLYARRHGYVITLSGRRRRLPQAQALYDGPDRREAERQAINSPVQGFANEINFMAALQIKAGDLYQQDRLRIVGTVHDSIHFWIRRKWVEQAVPMITEVMKHPALLDKMDIRLRVPVEVEVKLGPWGSGKELEQWITSQ